MTNENWMSDETRRQLVDEAKRLKMKFQCWLKNEEGRDIFHNLFRVFGQPPNGNTESEFARFTGRMEVLNYIISNSELLGGENERN
jgi:hypothetical protein